MNDSLIKTDTTLKGVFMPEVFQCGCFYITRWTVLSRPQRPVRDEQTGLLLFHFLQLGSHSLYSAFYSGHKETPVHSHHLWQGLKCASEWPNLEQHAGNSTVTRAKAQWAPTPQLSKTNQCFALGWGAVDKTWHLSEGAIAYEQAAIGRKIRVSCQGIRDQCLRIMDLNLDLRNFIMNGRLFPS